MDPAQVVSLRIHAIIGSMERYIIYIPCGPADGATKISMLDILGNAVEVERVGTHSGEDCMTLPSFHVTQANGTILYRKNLSNNQLVTFHCSSKNHSKKKEICIMLHSCVKNKTQKIFST